MKASFLLHPRTVANPFDAATLWSSARGLTGSEVSFFQYAAQLVRLGHEVVAYSNFTQPGLATVADAKLDCRPYEHWHPGGQSDTPWDVCVAWLSADPLRVAPRSAFRFFNQQCRGFAASEAGWEDSVDLLAPLSNAHARVLRPETTLPAERWRILHNGVDTTRFRPASKSPHKVIWASSHDRGLHHLLGMWRDVRAAVPDATLDIFYDMRQLRHLVERHLEGEHEKLGAMAAYVLDGIERLRGHGVMAHGSVSRERIEREMATASVLAYPLDVPAFTETFGVVVLEACAAGVVPVLCLGDAFGELWEDVALGVPPPMATHKAEFTRALIHALRMADVRRTVTARCIERAKAFDVRKLGVDLDVCLRTRGARGLPEIAWS